MIKYVLFDVSGTILGKPLLFQKINEVLKKYNYDFPLEEIKYRIKVYSFLSSYFSSKCAVETNIFIVK